MRSKLAAAVAGAAVISALGGAPTLAAGGSSTLGITQVGGVPCAAGAIYLQTVSPTGHPYFTSAAGVVTKVSQYANGTVGQFRVLFLVPAATDHYTLEAKGPVLATTSPSALNTFDVQIPVSSGWSLASQWIGANQGCVLGGIFGGVGRGLTFNPDTSTDATASAPVAGVAVNVQVTVEADDDRDGYGDDTQDGCPSDATTHGPCVVPDTTITKHPSRVGHHRKVKIKFTSTPAGSTFLCSLDGKASKACDSPYKKRVKYGKHTFTVFAVAPGGLPDPSPAKVKFKVKKPVRHH